MKSRNTSIFSFDDDDDSIFPNEMNQEEEFHYFYFSRTMEAVSYNKLILPPTCRLMKGGTNLKKDQRHNNTMNISSPIRIFSLISLCYEIISFDFINIILHFVCRVTNAFGHRWLGWKDSILEEDADDADEAYHRPKDGQIDYPFRRPSSARKEIPHEVGTGVVDPTWIDGFNISDIPKLLPPLKSKELKGFGSHRVVDKSHTFAQINHNNNNHHHHHPIQSLDKSIISSQVFLKPTRDVVSTSSPTISPIMNINPLHLRGTPTITSNIILPSPSSSPTRKHSWSIDLNFFDAASNDATLKRIVRDVALPDSHGYVLGDEYLMDSKTDTPLLVFVNSKSGSQQGLMLKIQFRRILNPIQVWDLSDGPPEPILSSFSVFTRLRILVCGGDGTVSWIISSLDKLKLHRWPPVAILPIGTGNDLARVYGWGGGFRGNENLISILNDVQDAYVSLLDRWEMSIFEKTVDKCSHVKAFTNYMSIGSDALSALQLHRLRQQSPNLFSSRILNKLWYALFGAEDAIKASCAGLHQNLTLIADGVEIPIPKDSQGLVFLNIDSYLGGCSLWARGVPAFRRRSMKRRYSDGDTFQRGEDYDLDHFDRLTDCSGASSCQDGKIDVVSYYGNFHLGQIRVGLGTAQLLCQCSELTIVLKKRLAIQIDGEPWKQDKAKIKIVRKNDPAVMLHKTGGDTGTESILAEVLEWAEDQSIIDREIHNALMKEYSRRIESKTRDRRNKSKENLLGLSAISRA